MQLGVTMVVSVLNGIAIYGHGGTANNTASLVPNIGLDPKVGCIKCTPQANRIIGLTPDFVRYYPY